MCGDTTVLGTAILALALGTGACATHPYRWIEPEPEPTPASPAEVAMRSGRIANSWSIVEYEESEHGQIICPDVDISILLANDSIWVGISTGDRRQIKRTESGYDWAALRETLQEYREMPVFAGPPARQDLQLAAADPVPYREILAAMDQAIAIDFTDLSLVQPRYLTVVFTEIR